MSEQLLIWNKVKIWSYQWYSDTGASTLWQLKKANIIPKRDYKWYENRKPDALLVDQRNKKQPHVVVICEYKAADKFRTEKQITEAIQQCNDLLQELDADLWIITDNQNKRIRINWKEASKENSYIDKNWKERSYTIIKNENKLDLTDQFIINQQSDQENSDLLEFSTKETLDLVETIRKHINKSNSVLKDANEVDPTGLAESVWQDIFVATGQEPEKCLYNVVELFVFKFLSDLSVLKSPYDFNFVLNLTTDNQVEWLEYYATIIRPKIRALFPPSTDDETTIINWTIFVYNWKAVSQNAWLFYRSIKKYSDFWDLTTIKKSFKTNLYEKFLKRDSWVKWLWQYFTPRKVITPIVEMAQVERLQSWAKVCDPFCWTWWFVMEALSRTEILKTFEPNSEWNITPKFEFYWFDKWSDQKDSERTIILAKANMLIYLSNIIKRHPNLTKKFSQIFNRTFKLKKDSILWTLNHIIDNDNEKFDLILTNPPYVTTGTRILKDEIKKSSKLTNFYSIDAVWLEWLSMEWIIRSLKPWWRAFLVVPDGILNRLNDAKLRKFILEECFLNWIISLPLNTFFTTPKKTYILTITKKNYKDEIQNKPVFSYLVSDIWETLDVYRFDTWQSDLEKAKDQYFMFQWSEENFKSVNNDPRCKIWSIEEFHTMIDSNRTVDKWWSKDERISLWIDEEQWIFTIEEFLEKASDVKQQIEIIEKQLQKLNTRNDNTSKTKTIEVWKIFDIERWKSKYTQKWIQNNVWDFNLYSAKTTENWLMWKINSYDFNTECLTYTTNGVYAWTLFYRKKHKFSLNGDSAIMLLKDKWLSYKYFYYTFKNKFKEHWFNWENKATPTKVNKMFIEIPIDKNWNYDINAQKRIAKKYEILEKLKSNIIEQLDTLRSYNVNF